MSHDDSPVAATTSARDLADRWDHAVMGNYGTPLLALVSGRGAVVTDADGREYVDLLAGIAVNSLGHAHPALVEAVTRQLSTLGHVSNLAISPPAVELAEELLRRFDAPAGARVFLCNSGTEANEAAFKIARRTGRRRILAADEGFHGRTMGALAMTGQPGKRAPFEPMPAGVEFYPYGDIAALRALVSRDPHDVAAVILEPIQGENGVIVPPAGFLADVRALCDQVGALMMVDEVQTGIGRTGAMFVTRAAGVLPDVCTLAKGLAGGLPIGALIATGAAGGLLEPGMHGTTFGGNPVAAAAALAVLRTIEADDLLGNVERVGKLLTDGVLAVRHPLVDHVRGAGLLLGIALTLPVAGDVQDAARAAGYIVNAARPDTVRLAPPLILTEDQARGFVDALPRILDAATATDNGGK